jgi:malonate decarboxylase beta subunit
MKTIKSHANYFEASARKRLEGILDPGSFTEFCGPEEKTLSPHLKVFNLPSAFDDGVAVGKGALDGAPVLVAAQEGKFMGGALGEIHCAKITGLLRLALKTRPEAVILLPDSGGVRLQEANAGEIGAAEIIRAIMDLRADGIPVIAAVGGSCGVFGGSGIITGCCDAVVISEAGRAGVSGPEVIETNMGAEEFDSRDRALVWRVYGGRSRRVLGAAGFFAKNTMEDFRLKITAALRAKRKTGLEALEAEDALLRERFGKFRECRSPFDIWRKAGIDEPERLSALSDDGFNALIGRAGL